MFLSLIYVTAGGGSFDLKVFTSKPFGFPYYLLHIFCAMASKVIGLWLMSKMFSRADDTVSWLGESWYYEVVAQKSH